jgi:ABC-type methionine transport system permease subunit
LLALHDTLIMVAVSLGFGALIGVPLGIVVGGLPSRRHRGQPGGASGAESAD